MHYFLKNSIKHYFFAPFSGFFVIPLGFEPKTHSLEGCCSNPTELRNHPISVTYSVIASAKVIHFLQSTK